MRTNLTPNKFFILRSFCFQFNQPFSLKIYSVQFHFNKISELTKIVIAKDGTVCAHLIENRNHLFTLCKGAHCGKALIN